MNSIINIIASFTSPIYIGETPASMFWLFPLLLSVSLIYKATKLRVMFLKRFFKEALVLFLSLSAFMIAAAVALNIIVHLLTS